MIALRVYKRLSRFKWATHKTREFCIHRLLLAYFDSDFVALSNTRVWRRKREKRDRKRKAANRENVTIKSASTGFEIREGIEHRVTGGQIANQLTASIARTTVAEIIHSKLTQRFREEKIVILPAHACSRDVEYVRYYFMINWSSTWPARNRSRCYVVIAWGLRINDLIEKKKNQS